MNKLTFYHQVRCDGGQRTGIDSDNSELLQCYKAGGEDADPALLWYLDVRCEGKKLPKEPAAARNWFVENRAFFTRTLAEIADQDLGAGFDADWAPFQREVSGAPDGARVLVVVSAVRRLVARQIAQDVRKVARNWRKLLDCLESPSVV